MLAIGVGQFALLATSGLMRGYVDNIRDAITGPMIGHAQIHAENWRQERAIDLVLNDVNQMIARINDEPLVESAAARIYAPVLVAPKEEAFIATVVGLQIESESRPNGILSGLEQPLEKGKVLIGHLLSRKMNAQKGQEIAVIGQASDGSMANDLFVIQDIIKCPVDMINQSGVVMSLADAQRLFVMPNQAHEIAIRAESSVLSKEICSRLSKLPILEATEILPWEEIVPELESILQTSDYTSYFVLIIVFVAAIAGIANTLMMSTFERFHEFGMLLALGIRPFRIIRMIVLEALLLGVLGIVVGTIFGYGFILGTSDSGIDMASWGGDGQVEDMSYMGLNLPLHVYPRLEQSDVMLGLAAVIFTSLVASIWPAWIAGRLEPMEAMRA